MSAASFDVSGAPAVSGADRARGRTPRTGAVPGRGLPRLRVVSPAGGQAGALRGPPGVLGRGDRDGLEGVRAHLHLPRGAVAAAGGDGDAGCVGARLSNPVLRLGGPVAGGRGGAQALADAGRRGAVPAPGPGLRLAGPAIDVDADPLPDVVLEVDHTTDVRKRKLGIYKGSGFPEVWVLVPWESSVRRPGLAIHVRRSDGYREEGESRAFPGWRAEEIHLALTESPLSATAWRALERVARAMGAREGHEAGGRSAHGLAQREGTDGRPGAGAAGKAAWEWWPRRSGPEASNRRWTPRRTGGCSGASRMMP